VNTRTLVHVFTCWTARWLRQERALAELHKQAADSAGWQEANAATVAEIAEQCAAAEGRADALEKRVVQARAEARDEAQEEGKAAAAEMLAAERRAASGRFLELATAEKSLALQLMAEEVRAAHTRARMKRCALCPYQNLVARVTVPAGSVARGDFLVVMVVVLLTYHRSC
jgi:hypothetical protein